MNRDEGKLSERVGARISPELKEQVQNALNSQPDFDSEADVVRTALWHYMEHIGAVAPLEIVDEQDLKDEFEIVQDQLELVQGDLEVVEDKVEWALSVIVVLTALIGSKVLNTLRVEKIKPAELVDEAIQETVFNRTLLWKRMRVGRKAAKHLNGHVK